MEEEPLRDPLEELSGTALRVYLLLLLEGRPMGVREVQRRLGLRSPSTARHHLERLRGLGLVEYTGEGYVARPPRTGLLASFTIVKGRLLPLPLAAAAFTAAAAVAYALLPGRDPAAVAVLLASAAVQTLAAWRLLGAARRLRRLAAGGSAAGK